MSNIDFNKIKPLVFKGEVQNSYYVSTEGQIFSVREMSPCVSGRCAYPKVGLVLNNGTKTTVPVHQVVASTFIPQEERRPNDISASDWKKTPAAVRKLLTAKMTDVHHKNGNKEDNSLSNLEYMCASKNRSIGNPRNKK